MSGDIPEAVRLRVLERDGYACIACGTAGENRLQLHHLTYRSQGGAHTATNLVTLCRRCHDAIHAGLLELEHVEWRANEFAWFRRFPRP